MNQGGDRRHAVGAPVEALFEQLLEFGDRPALHQHVPVGACDLVAGVVDLDNRVADAADGFGAAGAALPGLGQLGVGREGHNGLASALGADVRVVGALMEHDAILAL